MKRSMVLNGGAVKALAAPVAVVLLGLSVQAWAVFVPGTVRPLNTAVSDDFEDPTWVYNYENPKSGQNGGSPVNLPAGYSSAGYYSPVDNTFYSRLVEDTWRGQPEVVQRALPPVAASGYALELATRYIGDGSSYSDSLSWQQQGTYNTESFGGNIGLRPWRRPSSTLNLYVPDPSLWTSPYPFYTFSMIWTDVDGNGVPNPDGSEGDWIGMYFIIVTDNDGNEFPKFAWETGTDKYGVGNPSYYFWHEIDFTPEMAGWWTLGMSADKDKKYGLFAHQGLAPLTMADLLGTYDDVDAMIGVGSTLQIRHASTQMSPSWFVDNLNYYYLPEPSVLTVMGLGSMLLAWRRRR